MSFVDPKSVFHPSALPMPPDLSADAAVSVDVSEEIDPAAAAAQLHELESGGSSTTFEEKYEGVRLLNHGGEAWIHLVRGKATGNLFVARRFKSSEDKMRVLTAVANHQKLNHPHIVAFRDLVGFTSMGHSELVVITDYIPDARSLRDWLTGENSRHFTPDEIVLIAMQIDDALKHMHQRGVIHRDLKPSNVLVHFDAEDKPFVTIIDLGIARSLGEQTSTASQVGLIGSRAYMAPEQWEAMNGGKLSFATDYYQLGLVLLDLVRGRPRTESIHERNPLQEIAQLRKSLGAGTVQPEMMDFIVSLLERPGEKIVEKPEVMAESPVQKIEPVAGPLKYITYFFIFAGTTGTAISSILLSLKILGPTMGDQALGFSLTAVILGLAGILVRDFLTPKSPTLVPVPVAASIPKFLQASLPVPQTDNIPMTLENRIRKEVHSLLYRNQDKYTPLNAASMVVVNASLGFIYKALGQPGESTKYFAQAEACACLEKDERGNLKIVKNGMFRIMKGVEVFWKGFKNNDTMAPVNFLHRDKPEYLAELIDIFKGDLDVEKLRRWFSLHWSEYGQFVRVDHFSFPDLVKLEWPFQKALVIALILKKELEPAKTRRQPDPSPAISPRRSSTKHSKIIAPLLALSMAHPAESKPVTQTPVATSVVALPNHSRPTLAPRAMMCPLGVKAGTARQIPRLWSMPLQKT